MVSVKTREPGCQAIPMVTQGWGISRAQWGPPSFKASGACMEPQARKSSRHRCGQAGSPWTCGGEQGNGKDQQVILDRNMALYGWGERRFRRTGSMDLRFGKQERSGLKGWGESKEIWRMKSREREERA